jgi:hypothetical protein
VPRLKQASHSSKHPSTHSPEQSAEQQLASFISRFSQKIAALTEAILEEMRRRYPSALELVYDNYNALAIGFSPSERPSEGIFSIAVFPNWISLFFLQGKELPDPQKILQGTGNVVRHIRVPSLETLDHPAVKSLMLEAESRAKVPLDPRGIHRIIIKSVSAKQRPRRPAGAA